MKTEIKTTFSLSVLSLLRAQRREGKASHPATTLPALTKVLAGALYAVIALIND
jgi:hypothetical protein